MRRAALVALGARGALIALPAFSAATHGATLAVLLALAAAAVAAALLRPDLVPTPGARRGVAALVLGAVLLSSANYAVAGRLAWTPGGMALPFGRMLQDGLVARFLAEHCPDARLRLCRHRDELPTDADVSSGAKACSTGSAASRACTTRCAPSCWRASRAYPLLQLGGGGERGGAPAREGGHRRRRRQLDVWHTYNMIEQFTPAGVAGDARGAPAARRARLRAGQPPARAGRARRDGAAARDHRARAARDARFADLGPLAGHRRARDPRQCRRMRPARQSARPLRRAHGVDRRAGGAAHGGGGARFDPPGGGECNRPPRLRRSRRPPPAGTSALDDAG